MKFFFSLFPFLLPFFLLLFYSYRFQFSSTTVSFTPSNAKLWILNCCYEYEYEYEFSPLYVHRNRVALLKYLECSMQLFHTCRSFDWLRTFCPMYSTYRVFCLDFALLHWMFIFFAVCAFSCFIISQHFSFVRSFFFLFFSLVEIEYLECGRKNIALLLYLWNSKISDSCLQFFPLFVILPTHNGIAFYSTKAENILWCYFNFSLVVSIIRLRNMHSEWCDFK